MFKNFNPTRKRIISSTTMAATLFFAAGLFTPFVTPYLLSHGFDKQQISFIASLSPLMLIIFPPIFGKLSDIVGRRKVISITLCLLAISRFFYLGVDHNYLYLVLATMFAYVGFDNAANVIFAKNEDNLSQRRSLFTGLFESLKTLGLFLGIGLGTFIVTTSNIENTLKLSFLIICLLFIYNNLRGSHNHVPLSANGLNPFRSIRDFWAVKDLRGLGILGISMHFANAASVIFIPVLTIQTLGADIRYIGYFALAGSLSHLSQVAFGYSCELYGSGKTIIRSTLLYGSLISLLFFATSPWFVVMFGLIGGLALAAWNTSAVCYMSEIGERLKEEGLVMGSYTSVASMGGFAGFIASGFLVTLLEVRYLFPIYGVIIVAGVIISYPYIKASKYY